MQEVKRKGKAAAEAAALPVMEESKMETIILYHHKRKPPRINRGGPDHSANKNTILPCVYRYAHIIPHETKEPRCPRGSPENTPQNHSPQRKEDTNHYMQSVSTVNEKAAGAPYSPTACKHRPNRRSG